MAHLFEFEDLLRIRGGDAIPRGLERYLRPPVSGPDDIEGQTAGDGLQPGHELPPAFVPSGMVDQAEESFLRDVLAMAAIPRQSRAEPHQAAAVALDQGLERGLGSARDLSHEVVVDATVIDNRQAGG